MRHGPAVWAFVASMGGQALAQGLEAVAALAVTETYDDNLFSSPENEARDMVTTLKPSIEARHRSASWFLKGLVSVDGEIYRDHTSLSSATARRAASLEGLYTGGDRLSLVSRHSLSETNSPSEFAPLLGLELGRRRAQRFLADEALSVRLGARTDARLDYDFTWDKLSGGIGGRTHVASLGLDRKIRGRDTATCAYTLQRFDFEGTAGGTSHVVALGWTRALTSRTRIRVLAGPRFSQGGTGAEAELSLRHAVKRGEIALAGSHGQTRVIGLAGPVLAESVSFTATGEWWRDLRVTLAPAFSRSRLAGFEATVYRTSVDIGYRIAKWLWLEGSHHWSLQHGNLGGPLTPDTVHNVVSLRLAAATPERLRPPAGPGDELGRPRPRREAEDEEEAEGQQ